MTMFVYSVPPTRSSLTVAAVYRSTALQPRPFDRPRFGLLASVRRLLRARRSGFRANVDVLMEAAGFGLLLAAFLLPLYLLG